MATNGETDAYQTYLLRLWRARCKGQWLWRVSIESPRTGERHCFASLEQCFKFLHGQFGSQVPGSPEEELNHRK